MIGQNWEKPWTSQPNQSLPITAEEADETHLGHTPSQWQGQDLIPGLLASCSQTFPTSHSFLENPRAIFFSLFSCFIGVQLLYNGVLISAVQRSESAMCIPISPPSWTSLPPQPPIPPIQVITERQAELPVLYSRFPLAICFTHGSVYMSILI